MTATQPVEGKEELNDAEQAGAIARAFVEARNAGGALPDYPGRLPATLDEGYRIQEQAIAHDGRRIAGWKVGRIADHLVPTFGNNRLTGPIFADQIVTFDGNPPGMEMFADGFGAAEAEYLLRIGSLPASGKTSFTNEEAAACVDEIRVGIEVASSPFPGINEHGPAVTASDFGNNNGLVLGAELPRESDFLDWKVALTIDGETAGEGTAATMLDGPFGAVRFLLELAAERGLPLAVGQWVSTGAVTGVHPVQPGAAVVATFDTRYSVACTIGTAGAR